MGSPDRLPPVTPHRWPSLEADARCDQCDDLGRPCPDCREADRVFVHAGILLAAVLAVAVAFTLTLLERA